MSLVHPSSMASRISSSVTVEAWLRAILLLFLYWGIYDKLNASSQKKRNTKSSRAQDILKSQLPKESHFQILMKYEKKHECTYILHKLSGKYSYTNLGDFWPLWYFQKLDKIKTLPFHDLFQLISISLKMYWSNKKAHYLFFFLCKRNKLSKQLTSSNKLKNYLVGNLLMLCWRNLQTIELQDKKMWFK